jgi:hypothetical protein
LAEDCRVQWSRSGSFSVFSAEAPEFDEAAESAANRKCELKIKIANDCANRRMEKAGRLPKFMVLLADLGPWQ